jgi:glutamate--cysteine ligase regulatory subunit
MQLILSTGNVVSVGPTIRKPGEFRSNLELTTALRSAFLAAKEDYAPPLSRRSSRATPPPPEEDAAVLSGAAVASSASSDNGSAASSAAVSVATPTSLDSWTERESVAIVAAIDAAAAGGPAHHENDTAPSGDILYVPRIDWSPAVSALQERPEAYDITLKLFFLPLAPLADRPAHARKALALVRRRLGLSPTAPIDLLILSFPGVSFEGDCEVAADRRNAVQGNLDDEVATWRALEPLHASGEVRALGLAEFGSQKLGRFLERVAVRPAVDQINVRDCCKVPKALAELGASAGIELLVHSDCNDILPGGTLRELLGHGNHGAGLLADPKATSGDAIADVGGASAAAAGLRGDVTPLWVVKYTAFVKDRGVVENKGYFAAADLAEGR